MTFSLINELNESVEGLLALIEAAEVDFFESSDLFEDIEWKDDPANKQFIGQGKTGETGAGLKARRERQQIPAASDIIRLQDQQGNAIVAVIKNVSNGKISYAFKDRGQLQQGVTDAAKLKYQASTKGNRKVFAIQQ